MPEIQHVYVEKEGSHFSLRLGGQQIVSQAKTQKDEAMLTGDVQLDEDIKHFFTRNPSSPVMANADRYKDIKVAYEEYHAYGDGLARSENQLGDTDLPTRAFFRDLWREMALQDPTKIVRIRALDWKTDKRNLMMSHVTFDGKRFYLDNSLGVEILKEQLRAILDLKAEGIHNIEFLFPMVEGPDAEARAAQEHSAQPVSLSDNEQIAEIVGEVLLESDYRSLIQKPIGPDGQFAAVTDEELSAIGSQELIDYFPVPLGIMIETEQGWRNLDIFAKLKWIKFFSIGSNDLISEVYHVSREDKEANVYYEDIYPKIIRYILDITFAAQASGKKCSICGELGSKQRFWFIRALINSPKIQELLSNRRFEITPSMPSTSIPNYNIVDQLIGTDAVQKSQEWLDVWLDVQKLIEKDAVKKSQEWVRVQDILKKILTADISSADAQFKDAFKEALLDLSTAIDGQKKILIDKLKATADTTTKGKTDADAAMLVQKTETNPAASKDRYGGVDFTQYRDSVTVQQNGPAVSVPLPNGQTIIIGGPDFAGFTFDIIQIIPYTTGM